MLPRVSLDPEALVVVVRFVKFERRLLEIVATPVGLLRSLSQFAGCRRCFGSSFLRFVSLFFFAVSIYLRLASSILERTARTLRIPRAKPV